jgi:hypothetical protein
MAAARDSEAGRVSEVRGGAAGTAAVGAQGRVAKARPARDYGDACSFRAGLERVFFVNHPDCVREVLVNHYDNFLKGEGRRRAKKFLGEGVLRILGPLVEVARAGRARLRIVNPNPLKWEAQNPNRRHTR